MLRHYRGSWTCAASDPAAPDHLLSPMPTWNLIGWAGLARRSPCEWITAATPLKLIGFSAETFSELERDSDQFSAWLDSNNSPAEIMAILEPALRKRPHAEPHEREVLRQLLPQMKLLAARNDRQLPLDDGGIWLWNAQPSDLSVPVGEKVDPAILSTIPPGSPLRILRIESDAWQQVLDPVLEELPEPALPDVTDLWGDDRYSDLLAPNPQGERQGSTQMLPSGHASSPIQWKGRALPEVTGIGTVGQMLACLEMLSQFYNVPFRRDVIERAAKESMKDRDIDLETLGNLATILGFIGTICDIPSAQLPRLAFPCFALVDGDLAMLHDISRGQVKAVFPEYGRVTFPQATLLSDQPGVRVLTLAPGRDSQQRKPTLAGFFRK